MKSPHKKSCELNFLRLVIFFRRNVVDSSIVAAFFFLPGITFRKRHWRWWRKIGWRYDMRNASPNINHIFELPKALFVNPLAHNINCSFVNNYWATVYCGFSQLCAECLATSFSFLSSPFAWDRSREQLHWDVIYCHYYLCTTAICWNERPRWICGDRSALRLYKILDWKPFSLGSRTNSIRQEKISSLLTEEKVKSRNDKKINYKWV